MVAAGRPPAPPSSLCFVRASRRQARRTSASTWLVSLPARVVRSVLQPCRCLQGSAPASHTLHLVASLPRSLAPRCVTCPQFCTLSSGGYNPFWSNREAPIAGTESQFTASGECLSRLVPPGTAAQNASGPQVGRQETRRPGRCPTRRPRGHLRWPLQTQPGCRHGVQGRVAQPLPTRMPPPGPAPRHIAVIGCTYYVIAAWIWSIIWHFGLDPLKVCHAVLRHARCGVLCPLSCLDPGCACAACPPS